MTTQAWIEKIFNTETTDYADLALELFRFQYRENSLYRDYTDALKIRPEQVSQPSQIPFLPIRFFKTRSVTTTQFEPALVFESSGTTGMINSRHLVREAGLYEASFNRGFRQFYGDPADWCIIGLLPAYLERQRSSLVYMTDRLIRQSNHPASGFYLYEYDRLSALLAELEAAGQKVWLIGVTFALLDFAEQYPRPLKHTVLLETGGMKGRREELIRPAVHERLQKAFGLPAIHAEYGMTELLSQAYSAGNGLFRCPAWMQVAVRDEEDPLTVRFRESKPVSGAINIIDLANLYSCAFIATDDAGRIHPDGTFEVLGRLDNSDLRGCSLLVV